MNQKINRFIEYFFYAMPFALVSGPFLSDFFLVIICILFLLLFCSNQTLVKYFTVEVKFIFLFCLYLLILSLLSSQPYESLSGTLFYFRYPIFLMSIMYIIDQNNNFIRNLLFSFIVIILLLFFDSLFQFYYGVNIFYFEMTDQNRISSFFKDELIMGSFVVRLLPLILGLLIISFHKYKYNFFIGFVLFTICCLLIILSAEKNAIILSLLIIFTSILVYIKKINYLFYITIPISFILYIAFNLFYKTILGPILYEFNILGFETSIFKVYYNIFINSIELIKENFFFGVGPKLYELICINQISINNSCTNHPHNIYLQIFSETGFFGFIFLLTAVIYVFTHFFYLIFKSFKKNFNYHSQAKLFFLLSTVIFLFPFSQYSNFFNNWLSIIAFLPIGFYIYYLRFYDF